jgi:ADP-heptose:LPS heptosyltransferase
MRCEIPEKPASTWARTPSKVQARQTPRILVLNLTRLGDLVQMGPLLAGLRARHPRARLGLLALSAFAPVARLLPGVDEVLELDQDQVVGRLLDARRPLSARAAWQRGLVRELRGEGWDLVINLSHSRDSAVLASLLARGEVRGIHALADGRLAVGHPWAQYFFCVTGNRALNQLNLVDIYRRAGDLAPGEGDRLELRVGPAAMARADELLAGLPAARGPLVLVQPGASCANRRWPPERLAQALRRLHTEAGAAFLLLGSGAEAPLCAELAELARGLPLLDLAGRTSLEELAALCSRGELLITNDTGTLHVAAARGLPSVSLFFATALPWETGPWREGCLILHAEMECAPCSHHVSCPHVMCRERIGAGLVADAALELLRRRGWPATPGAGWLAAPGAQVWETARGADGLLDLRPLGRRRPAAEELAGRIYRRLWRTRLGDAAAAGPRLSWRDELRGWLSDWDAPSPAAWRELAGWERDLETQATLADEGLALVSRAQAGLARADAAALSAAVEALPRLDDRLHCLELSRPLLRPLGALFRLGRDELREEESLERLGAQAGALYRELGERSRRMAELAREARVLLEAAPAALAARQEAEA